MADTYTTISGDMWDKIAYEKMGGEMYVHLLLRANPKHVDTVVFPAGVELVIPEVPASTAATLPPWRR